MKKILLIALLFLSTTSHAALNVFACEPEWAALTQLLAGDKANIYTATGALQDPHRVEARPSLIAKARRANLLVCTGAELETGWLPVILRESGNSAIQPGSPGAFEAAERAARQLLSAQQPVFAASQWRQCYGSAGTVNAVVDVLTANGWPGDVVTTDGLNWLLQQLLHAGHADRLQLPGVRDDRKPIIGGGLSVLRAIFDLLDIQQLTPCSGGLRHGLLIALSAYGGSD